jgi:hypothetical protein
VSQSRGRAGRVFFIFLVIVAVIVAGLFGVDRWAHNRAEGVLEDKITSTDSASFSNLDTSIEGFPFLTQVLNDNLEHVQLTADTLTSSATESELVTIENLDVNLRGINPNAPYLTQSLDASGTLPFAVVERIVHDYGFEGVAVSATDSGALAFTVEVFGYPVTASASIKVSESGRGFIFNIEDADLGGFSFDLGSILPTDRTEIEIQQLPEGVHITDAQVVGSGVELTVQGNDLALQDLTL